MAPFAGSLCFLESAGSMACATQFKDAEEKEGSQIRPDHIRCAQHRVGSVNSMTGLQDWLCKCPDYASQVRLHTSRKDSQTSKLARDSPKRLTGPA
eukprot:1160355-Pelagomonas_calceolata.AAC.4